MNIGNDEEVRIIDLAKIVKNLTDSSSEITFYPLPQDDPQRRCPDIRKVQDILEWKPKVKLEEGLRKTIEWFREISYMTSKERIDEGSKDSGTCA